MNEQLVQWLFEHPENARGINITITGEGLTELIRASLDWAKEQYLNLQAPLRLTTEEVCQRYKTSPKGLYNLAHDVKDREGHVIQGALLHPEMLAGKNLYRVDELESVLKRKREVI